MSVFIASDLPISSNHNHNHNKLNNNNNNKKKKKKKEEEEEKEKQKQKEKEFELSDRNLVNRIIKKIAHAHNLHVKMFDFGPFTIHT